MSVVHARAGVGIGVSNLRFGLHKAKPWSVWVIVRAQGSQQGLRS